MAWLLWTALLLAAAGLVASGCATIDLKSIERQPSTALADPSGTRLHAHAAPQLAAQPGRSGFVVLERGLDAFVARAALAEAAERTLDLQYYIVHGDTSGRLLLGRVFAAAERGVRVRLLIDDWTLADADEALAQLDAHPSIEVRLFNPTANRVWFSVRRWLEVIGDFSRINRRMHNKAWISDNSAAIVGGRNLGDEYFEARDDLDYHDLDLLAIGPAVREASASFDRYWNSEFAVPLSTFRRVEGGAAQRDAVRRWFADDRAGAAGTAYVRSLETSPLVAAVREGTLRFVWGEARVLADDPAKLALPEDDPALKDATRGLLLAGQLHAIAPKARRELLVVSPYFVPGDSGVASFAALEASGVRVRILTNSLASNDVVPTQAGYARYREALLRAGVELHELKPRGTADRDGKGGWRDTIGGSSRAALHEKSFVADREWVFVGSLNLDPRSVRVNAEIGVLVRSPELASQVAAIFERNASAQSAWRVGLAEGGVEWIDEADGGTVRHARDPEASGWRRFMQGVYGIVAPESLL
jgi:putative cardiolipin synthase